jgi:alpha-1,2-mannosyltransferase
LLPVLVGLYVTATTFGGSLVPWRPVMVDLDVYRRAGRLLLDGGDVYNLPGQLPFLYPPFAALLAVPLALLPPTLVQVGWTVAGVLALLAVLYRFGLTGWVLSLVGSVTVLLVQPVTQTLAFGQLGIFLVALVLLDLAPGPRVLGRRRLPEGALTAVATAVKLTPGIFLLYLIATRRRRAAVATVLTGLAVTLASAAVLPSASLTFWGRLAYGETGLGHSLIYYTNQSVMADVVRMFGLGSRVALVGLALSAVVAALGVWAAVRWHRLGEVRWALTLCGVAGLLASPVSWLHHFVWVVPLALCLLQGSVLPADPALAAGAARSTTPDRPAPEQAAPGRPLQTPTWFQVLGWLFIGWVVAAPFRRLPNGADVELEWTWSQHLLASTTAVLGVALLVASLWVARPAPSPALASGDGPAGVRRAGA